MFEDLGLSADEMVAANKLTAKSHAVITGPYAVGPLQWTRNLILGAQRAVKANVVPSVMMAQHILESGWGGKAPPWGIKARQEDIAAGNSMKVLTHETYQAAYLSTIQKSPKFVRVDQDFNDGTVSVLLQDFFYWVPDFQGNVNRYFEYVAEVKPLSPHFIPDQRADFIAYLMQAPSYATGAGYAAGILEIIQDNSLEAFDHA